MELWGAKVFASPSAQMKAGKSFLAKNPEHPGSLGIAISEAIERALEDKNTKSSDHYWA